MSGDLSLGLTLGAASALVVYGWVIPAIGLWGLVVLIVGLIAVAATDVWLDRPADSGE